MHIHTKVYRRGFEKQNGNATFAFSTLLKYRIKGVIIIITVEGQQNSQRKQNSSRKCYKWEKVALHIYFLKRK